MATPKYKYINKLEGKRILILGGTSGIGFAIAEACFEYGAIITISGSKPERLDATVQRLRDSYGDLQSRVSTHVCDLSNEETIESNVLNLLKAATDNGTHKLNHLAFTAGDSIPMQPLTEANFAGIRRFGLVRFFGQVFIAKYLAEYMERSADSSFTITGGVNSWKPSPGWSLPASLGSQNEGLARGLAVDLAPIRTNLVSPGAINTELLKRRITPEREQLFIQKSLVQRLGRPEDTAEAYLYCMKDGFITGTAIQTNGGYLLV